MEVKTTVQANPDNDLKFRRGLYDEKDKKKDNQQDDVLTERSDTSGELQYFIE